MNHCSSRFALMYRNFALIDLMFTSTDLLWLVLFQSTEFNTQQYSKASSAVTMNILFSR